MKKKLLKALVTPSLGLLIFSSGYAVVPQFDFDVYNNSPFFVLMFPDKTSFTNATWCEGLAPDPKIGPGESSYITGTCNNTLLSNSFDSTVFYGYDENNGCYIKLECSRIDSMPYRHCGYIQGADTPIQCIGTAAAQITNVIYPEPQNNFLGFTTVTITFPNQVKADKK